MGFSEGFARGYGIANDTFEGIRADKLRKEELAYRDSRDKLAADQRREDLDRSARQRSEDLQRDANRDTQSLAFRASEFEARRQAEAAEREDRLAANEVAREDADRRYALLEANENREQTTFDIQQRDRLEQDQAAAADRAWRSIFSGIDPDPKDLEKITNTRFDPRRFASPEMAKDLDVLKTYFETGTGDYSQLSSSASRLFQPILNQTRGQKADGQYVPDRFRGWEIQDTTLDSLEPINPTGGGPARNRQSGFSRANLLVRVKNPETGEVGLYRAPATVGRKVGGTPASLDIARVVDYWQGNRLLLDGVQNNPDARRFFDRTVLSLNATQNEAIRQRETAKYDIDFKTVRDRDAAIIRESYEQAKAEAETSGERVLPYSAYERAYIHDKIGTVSDRVLRAQGYYENTDQYNDPFASVNTDGLMRLYQVHGITNANDAYYLYGLNSIDPSLWAAINTKFRDQTGQLPSISLIRKYEDRLFNPARESDVDRTIDEMVSEVQGTSPIRTRSGGFNQ